MGSGLWWIFITNSASFVSSLGSTSNEIPTFDVVSWFLSFFVWRWGWVVGFVGFSSQIPRLLCLRLVRQAMKIPTFDAVSWFLCFLSGGGVG